MRDRGDRAPSEAVVASRPVRATALRVARWLGVFVAVAPVLMGIQEGDGTLARSMGLHVLLAVPLLCALGLAWWRPRLGAVAYALLGAAYGGSLMPGLGPAPSLFVSAPLFLISGLFWWASSPRRPTPTR